MQPHSADVVIVGSGPTGAAYARIIRRDWPEARILMVEAGPQTAPRPGTHVANMTPGDRAVAELASQGPTRDAYAPITREEWLARHAGSHDGSLLRRQGLFMSNDDPAEDGVFAGFAAAAVGGMATQWTSGCPHPSLAERPPFIDASEMDAALHLASELLGSEPDINPNDPAADALRAKLAEHFDDGRPQDRRVQPMPLAMHRTQYGIVTHGIETILGDMLDEPEETFRILSETACRRIIHDNGRATGVVLCRPGTDDTYEVKAGSVVVACDSLHSPQLLWASGIRPDALGRNINDHYQVTRLIQGDFGGPMRSMSWIPRIDPWPFSVTISGAEERQLPFPLDEPVEDRLIFIGVFVASDITPENRIVFDDSKTDWKGLPSFSIRARPTEGDLARIEQGRALSDEITSLLGRPVPGLAATVLPIGSSLHYQGTIRMGETDDGTSVCDRDSRVWGFENLHVAGNGVIPTITATNPTPYSVALATLGARRIAAEKRSV
ncbi:GMC oxidoreductase [Pelagovum pacificum]|uniref:Choline dehydrogenase n=1 Tax=Pelagovum pacificum TaxID=2588711 RepID=A0A5C5GJQ8_9RHOB|nr:GMC oxidoreductase [Pelagovum pacificum]QQA43171.1 GMC family oxidoreductase N-terminal domain-containing protein [Pelagovum pacificum]TNY33686.1 choline dehydrogenase [Pelagovum pacificum]